MLCKISDSLFSHFPGSSGDGGSESDSSRGLRVILLGPAGGGRTSLAETLLGRPDTREHSVSLMESTKRSRVMDGREVTVIDTPDLLGTSLGNGKRATEALRGLQLATPGPHAFLLVLHAPGSSEGINQDAAREIQALTGLFGDEAAEYIIPVLTHADRLARGRTADKLVEVNAGGLKKALSLCGQRPELVDNRPNCPPETQSETRRRLLGRVTEMKTLRGHFVHELQRKEDRVREELLAAMAYELAGKLGHE